MRSSTGSRSSRPTFRDSILFRNVQTPLDIERTTGLTEGNIFQGELSLEQLFFNRPVPGLRPLPDARPRPVAVRLGDPSGRRDHGRERADRRARGPPGARPEGGLGGGIARSRATRALRRDRHRWRPQRAGDRGVPRQGRAADARARATRRARRRGGHVGARAGGRVPTLAHTVGRLRPSVVRDLELKRHGLSLVGPDVRVFAPGPDGDAVVLWGDVAKTAEGLRARIVRDADRVRRRSTG